MVFYHNGLSEVKIILFAVALIASINLIPDAWVGDTFMTHMSISGDGEEAMNDYEFTSLMIKFGISTGLALLVVEGYRRLRR